MVAIVLVANGYVVVLLVVADVVGGIVCCCLCAFNNRCLRCVFISTGSAEADKAELARATLSFV